MLTKNSLPYRYRSWRRHNQTALGLIVTLKGRVASWNGTKKNCETSDFFCTFRKNIECQDPGDMRPGMDEGQNWLEAHLAPWAKSIPGN